MIPTTFGVRFRAALYFAIAAGTVLVGALQKYADSDKFPSAIMAIWILLSAIVTGLVALRAYYDGSAQRHEDRLAGGTPTPILTASSSPPGASSAATGTQSQSTKV